MAQIDDFIREQFDRENPGERFPFREEQWAQALPLIEAAEQKRRRRGLLWWFVGLFLLGGGAWWSWHLSHQPTGANHRSVVAPQETSVGENMSTVPLASSMEQVNYLPEHAELPPAASNRKLAKATGNPAIKALGERNITSVNGLTSSQLIGKTKSTPSLVMETKPTRESKFPASSETSHAILGPTSNGLPAVSEHDFKASTPLNSTENVLTIDSIATSSVASWRNIPFLPITNMPLNRPIGKAEIAQLPNDFSPIQPVRESHFTVGMLVAASAYPPALAGQQWGATAGFYAAYWLRPTWSLSAGIMWRSQPTGSSPTDALTVARQLHYRFGYEEETFQQINRRLHFLEFPVSVRWYHHGWQLEGGAMYGQLISNQATIIQSSRSSLIPIPEITERNIRGKKSDYNQHYIAPFLGLSWQPLRFLSVDVRASYRPTSLLRNTTEYTDHSGPWRLDAGLRWQLFSNIKK